MWRLRRFYFRLHTFLRSQAAERELAREIASHLTLLEEEFRRRGLNPDDARAAARRQMGNVDRAKESHREARSFLWLEDGRRDCRYAVRTLARTPLFTVFAVASLALGIGATTAIFSLFDAIVLRELPVRDPERLVVASFGRPGRPFNYSMPYPQFAEIRDRNTTLDGIFAVNPMGRVNVEVRGEPDIVEALYATGDYYTTLGLAPAVGRLLTNEDDRTGNAVAVLSYPYWQRRFGGSPGVVGTAIAVNRVAFTVVGVEPVGFAGAEVGRPSDVTVPMRTRDVLTEGNPAWNSAFTTWIYIMGRLKADVPLSRAEQELGAIFRQVSTDGARSPAQERLAMESIFRLEPGATGLRSDLRDAYGRWLRLVLGVLGAVLLLASLNVAALMLSRSETRRREIVMRLALGAGRGRVVRQFLTESLLLAAMAGAIGLAAAWWGSRALLSIATPGRLPVDTSPNGRVLAFTMAVSALTCVLFGLLPALRATSLRRLAASRHVGGGRHRRALDRALVVSQIALSLGLLLTAGLFLRSLGTLWAQDTGYDRRNVVMVSVDARLAGKRGADVIDTYRRLLAELQAIPGAQSVSLSAVRPVSDTYYFISMVRAAGDQTFPDGQSVRIAYNIISPGYFDTLRVPLVAGRDFDARDAAGAPAVAIISERMARHFRGSPIGQRIAVGDGALEVVGVARDTRYARVKDAPREVVYLPIFQSAPRDVWYTPTFAIRYAGTAADIVRSARAATRRTDPGLSLINVKTLEEQTRDSFSRERLLAMLTSYFGAFAALLSCIGLYGLMSYGVTQRTAEIGVRMSLGARTASIRWLIVREGAIAALAGIVIGLAGSWALARTLRSQLFGVEPSDPAALAGATLLLLAVALGAAYVPAARACRIDPVIALRHE